MQNISPADKNRSQSNYWQMKFQNGINSIKLMGKVVLFVAWSI